MMKGDIPLMTWLPDRDAYLCEWCENMVEMCQCFRLREMSPLARVDGNLFVSPSSYAGYQCLS